jgi:hypothetical protein
MATNQAFNNQVVNIIDEIQNIVFQHTTHPIFHRAIDSSKGVQITGTFKTTHSGGASPMSYITVRRRDDKAVVADGLGLAWRTGLESEGEYNIYFVDNNILTDDIPIRTENMIIEENLNNFLGYGIANIEEDTEYKFGLEIDSTWGMKACVYSGTFSGSPNFDSAYDAATNVSGYRMSLGARLDGHEPQSSGTHFGVAVLDTGDSDWAYDDLRITTTVEGYVAGLFKLYATPAEFPEESGFQIYGVGAAEGSPSTWGLTWYIWNVNSTVWEEIGANLESTTESFTYVGAALSGYVDASNFVNVMALTDDSSMDGSLNIDYVKLTTQPASGIHTGHMTDIYVHAPGQIARATTEITGITGGIAELDSLHHPIHEIEQVYYTAGGPILGELIRDTASGTGRYTVANSKPYYTYSTEEDLSLYVPLDANITVVYTYYADGDAVQAFVDHDDNRLPTVENLVKVTPPSTLSFNVLEYRGPIEEEQLKTIIADWVNALIREDFEISDMIAYLYTRGITYINLNTLDISIKVYSITGDLAADEAVTTSYSVTAPNTFYTDSAKMLGVTKL